MSGAQVTDTDDRGAAPNGADVGGIDPETERVARANGWKPRREFRGDPEKWTPADVFIARGFDTPAILSNRNKMLSAQVEDLRTQLGGTNERIEEAVSTIKTLTQMNRSAEQRAYDRARKELKTEMEQAVEAGDTAKWRLLDAERETLEATKPAAVDATPKPGGGTNAPPARTAGPTDPAVRAFYDRNPWYDPARTRENRDEDMMAFADTIHQGLLFTRKDFTMAQNLAAVEAEVRNRFPERMGGRRQPAARDPDPDAGVDDDTRNNGQGGGGDDRRNDPPAVIPSSGANPAPRRRANRFSFDGMPQDSKDQYTRYVKVLDGKGAPLTKEEWAADYWAQFRDDGNP